MPVFDDALRDVTRALKREARAERYKTDPVAWAEDILGIMMWSKQREILMSVVNNKRTAVKTCHSIGKTFISSVASGWWVSTRDDCMVQSSAPTYQQVHSLLWEEIRKMHLKANLKGRITLGDQWLVPQSRDGRVKDTLVAEGKRPADTNIHGFHGTHRPDGVLVILDEACGVPDTIYTGSEAITTARIDRILAVGNPDDPNTEFGRVFTEAASEWNLITVSAYDTPLFYRMDGTREADEMIEKAKKLDMDAELVAEVNKRDGTELATPHMVKVMAILDHMPDPEWIESRKRDWGEDSPRFLSKVLAIFPKTSIDSLFTATEIETGRNAVIADEFKTFRVFGVDVARYGGDKTVIAQNIGGDVSIVGAYNTMDTMEVAATVHKLAIDLKIDQVRVDGIGVGGGVVDRLFALSHAAGDPYVVVEMTASASPPDRALHRNSRAYWYDSLKYQLRNELISLPTDKPIVDADDIIIKDVSNYAKELIKEMGMIKYSYPNGIMLIESKEDIRRRGDKSPDFVDAVVMATAPINYIESDPLASARPGQMFEIDAVPDFETVSPF